MEIKKVVRNLLSFICFGIGILNILLIPYMIIVFPAYNKTFGPLTTSEIILGFIGSFIYTAGLSIVSFLVGLLIKKGRTFSIIEDLKISLIWFLKIAIFCIIFGVIIMGLLYCFGFYSHY